MHFGQERRAVERQCVNRGALLIIPGVRGVYSCSVRDLSRLGASLRLNGLALLATEFRLSLDGLKETAFAIQVRELQRLPFALVFFDRGLPSRHDRLLKAGLR